ncbi:MAG TPA: ATP-binding cassette domain-containing protein [Kofleriaceae bacterium]|nr:ATP-binding cassette domain-containing protein [Kofleriaceae bacterium]
MIELAGVHFAHDGAPDLLTELELRIAPGEVVAVEAAAGAGATTLVRLLLGELTARGRVAFAGRDVARLRSGSRAALRRRLGVVPQDLGLIGRDTALANVALALEVCGVSSTAREARARALLASVDVEPSLTVDRLSMAARQRVAWARAVVRSPDALLADQPTSHQDADGAARFATLVGERAELGAACLVLTRDPHLIAAGARLGWRMLALHRTTLVDVIPVPEVPDVADSSAPVPVPVPVPRPTPELPVIPAAIAVSGAIDLPDIGPAGATVDSGPIDIDLDDLSAIPNVVPFPRARSAGNRR